MQIKVSHVCEQNTVHKTQACDHHFAYRAAYAHFATEILLTTVENMNRQLKT